jgi:hypothetical protein
MEGSEGTYHSRKLHLMKLLDFKNSQAALKMRSFLTHLRSY